MTATPDDTLHDLVARAIRAPSSHNTQPWIFCLGGEAVELHADRRRALPVNDPEDRELTISCGCALMNLRVAAAAAGLAARTTLLPDADDPDWLARLETAPGPGPEAHLGDLDPAIDERRTWRKRFADTPVPRDAVDDLKGAAAAEGAWLEVLADGDERERAAALVAEGDHRQWDDPRWRRELAAWMHPRRAGDGLAVPGLAAPLAHAVVRRFDMGGGVAARDGQLAEASPLLAVLGTREDGPGQWLRAGQGLQHLLLKARQHGLQASYLNQPLQVAELRPRLRELVGRDGQPQILLRLGVADTDLPASPRRPLDAVLESAD